MNYQEINKQNIHKWEETLIFIIQILDLNKIKYYISASGLHYITGSKIYPHDIDLFMSKKNVKETFNLLKKFSLSKLHKWENKYLEFQGEYIGIPFEICEWEKPVKMKTYVFNDLEVSIVA